MTDDDIVSHYLTSLDSTRFPEVCTEVNTKPTMHAEYRGDLQESATCMDARFGAPNAQAGPLPVPRRPTVTLQQVMALCVEVEDRNSSKTVTPITVNAASVLLCHFCKKPRLDALRALNGALIGFTHGV